VLVFDTWQLGCIAGVSNSNRWLPAPNRQKAFSYQLEVSLKFRTSHSYDHAQQRVHEEFLREFVMSKILAQGGLGNDVPKIGEGEAVATFHFMPAFWDICQQCSIDPREGNCHHREVDVIDHGMGVTGLAFATHI
jgi:hypothetical protein